MSADPPFSYDSDDITNAERVSRIRNKMVVVRYEVLVNSISEVKSSRKSEGTWENANFSEEAVVYLFCGADFDCPHHFACGDDHPAKGF